MTMKSIVLASMGLLFLAAPAWAVSPVVRLIQPVGGQRGTEVAVTLSGQRLNDIQEILFYQPGITVTKIVGGQEPQAVVTLKISETAALGLHDFRVRTATGVSSLKTFSVGTLKEVAEVEPNNDFAGPQKIDMNVTVNGVAGNEDIDYYEVNATKGQRITVEVEGIRLGLTLFDPYVAILNAKRFELASSDDSALIWQDGLVSLVVPEDGTYVIAVREAAYAGNAQSLYRLHVGRFPRPTATLPAGGKFGDHVKVRWIGDVMGETTTEVDLPGHTDRSFGLLAHDATGSAPYPNAFRLSPFGNTIESEPNDTHNTATPFTPPVALNGAIEHAGDVDSYRFKARKGENYDVRVLARGIRSPLDPVLNIFGKNSGRVASNDDDGGPDSYLRFTAAVDGDFVVSVADHLQNGGPDYTYRVEISPVSPRLELSTPNESLRRGTNVMAPAIPRGNRQAILIQARREDFSGAISLFADRLPAGVTAEADEMTAGNSVLPVLFRADLKAPIGATLVNITGKPTGTRAQVPCEFSSTAELVLGQNNVPFWTRTVDSLAVAVTEEAPFTVEIAEPKVPIVRGGSMDLKVVARRKPGFTAPIAVALPWNPPGIASKNENVIPENQNEATILINASGGAELKTWRIVVNGTYTEPPPATPAGATQAQRRRNRGGRLVVSSEFARLTVAPQFLNLKLEAASVEQGSEVDLRVNVNKAVDFAGEAKMTLIGLPNKVTTSPVTITKDTTEAVFHLKTDAKTPPGETKSLFCQVLVMQNGEPILHNLGSGRLRVDAPLAMKKTPISGPANRVKPGNVIPIKNDPNRPLSRLEKLRLESREKAQGGDAPR
jgi:Bacterial pre-peptidase C-terminal domain